MEKKLKQKLLPFILTVAIIILDQITKILIVKNIAPYTIGAQFFGDFLRIIHVSNSGVAFSFGASWPLLVRRIAFSIVPIIVMILVIVVYLRNNDFTKMQRWCIAGIIGGGIGNIIDRIFRAEGVVDFIDVKFYGLFGLERWPTFNVADSAVVVCGILLVISFIKTVINESKENKSK
jgi:signal peptidase II